MSKTYSGSCLCGAVRYGIDGEFEHFYLCHCQHCRKDTGSAHAANLFATHATLRWVAGADKVTSFTLPNTRHARNFCSVCGSALPSLQAKGTLLVAPAGSLDSDLLKKPDAHLFMASKASWDHDLDTVPKMDRYPA